eukprot:TRINITY_DN24112_c0_g1_i3.p3 TRINITY_DN24112_c0_g1~~TRINITY_DN24112_c0_g1_i3.p3  ORF type:complete len:101 (+),score=9.39 TRINITY_DN24112_c0_g1_i3:221-523(+)
MVVITYHTFVTKRAGIISAIVTYKRSTFQQYQNKKMPCNISTISFHQTNSSFTHITVSYTHLTLPTILLVQISVVAVSLKKKKIINTAYRVRLNQKPYKK